MTIRTAKYSLGLVVRHRVYPFRGVIFDVDPTFKDTGDYSPRCRVYMTSEGFKGTLYLIGFEPGHAH